MLVCFASDVALDVHFWLQLYFGGQGIGVLHEETPEEEGQRCKRRINYVMPTKILQSKIVLRFPSFVLNKILRDIVF